MFNKIFGPNYSKQIDVAEGKVSSKQEKPVTGNKMGRVFKWLRNADNSVTRCQEELFSKFKKGNWIADANELKEIQKLISNLRNDSTGTKGKTLDYMLEVTKQLSKQENVEQLQNELYLELHGEEWLAQGAKYDGKSGGVIRSKERVDSLLQIISNQSTSSKERQQAQLELNKHLVADPTTAADKRQQAQSELKEHFKTKIQESLKAGNLKEASEHLKELQRIFKGFDTLKTILSVKDESGNPLIFTFLEKDKDAFLQILKNVNDEESIKVLLSIQDAKGRSVIAQALANSDTALLRDLIKNEATHEALKAEMQKLSAKDLAGYDRLMINTIGKILVDIPLTTQLDKQRMAYLSADHFMSTGEISKAIKYLKVLISESGGPEIVKRLLTQNPDVLSDNFEEILPVFEELAKTSEGFKVVKEMFKTESSKDRQLLGDGKLFKIALPWLKRLAKTSEGQAKVKELLSMHDNNGHTPMYYSTSCKHALGWFTKLGLGDPMLKDLLSIPQKNGKPLMHTPHAAKGVLSLLTKEGVDDKAIIALLQIPDKDGRISLENPRVLAKFLEIAQDLDKTQVKAILSLPSANGKPFIHDEDIFRAVMKTLQASWVALVQDANGRMAVDNPKNYATALMYLKEEPKEAISLLSKKAPELIITDAHLVAVAQTYDSDFVEDNFEDVPDQLMLNLTAQELKEAEQSECEASYFLGKSDIVIKTTVEEVKEKPLAHLARLSNLIGEARKKDKSEDLSTNVTFEGSEGIDAGGLSNAYMNDLFESLAKTDLFTEKTEADTVTEEIQRTYYIPKASQASPDGIPSLTPLEIKTFENMGSALMHLFRDEDVACGSRFDKSMYHAVLNLRREDVNTDFNQLPSAAKWNICKSLVEGSDQLEETKFMLISLVDNIIQLETILEQEKTAGEPVSDEQLEKKNKLIESIFDPASNVYLATDEDLGLDHYQQNPQALLTAVKEGIFSEQLQQAAPIHAIARGMRSQLPVDDWSTEWEKMQEKGAAYVMLEIQGQNFTRQDLANCISFDSKTGLGKYRGHLLEQIHHAQGDKKAALESEFDAKMQAASEEISKKSRWLKDWIMDPNTPETDVTNFLKYVTGRNTIPNEGIAIQAQMPMKKEGARAKDDQVLYHTLPKAQTCFNLLEIAPVPSYVMNDTTTDLNDTTKEGFIRCLLKGMEQSGDVFDLE